MRQRGWQYVFKRGVDVVGAAAGLTLLGPVMGATALAVSVSLGTPVFFKQTRAGLNGLPFTLSKFRTMRDTRAADGSLLQDSARVTRTGRFLRSLSLDELPQLWNVLRGDMSLIGPRPLLTQYVGRYTPHQARRHEVLPGMTGWAQVNGRNALTHEERFDLDVWYVDHWSLALDARIAWLTLRTVFGRIGSTPPDQVTMPEFLGTPQAVEEQPAQH
jgi:lipopolysaccharide/colanic/teichoic acid biosynthesis glycosyltransferase